MFGPVEKSSKHPTFYKMPTGSGHYFGREKVGRKYGQPFLIAFLMELSQWWYMAHPTHPFGIGDIAEIDGRPMTDHKSHTLGSAVDIFLIHKQAVKRDDRKNLIHYKSKQYDFKKTADLAYMISILLMRYPANQYFFNDPDMQNLIKSEPAMTTFDNHDEHIHITFNGGGPYSNDKLTEIFKRF